MTSSPSRWLIVGQKVIDEVAGKAPERVKTCFVEMLRALEGGPYPGNHILHCTEAKGLGYPNAFITWYEDVMILYQVMRDQPVVSLVGVMWTRD